MFDNITKKDLLVIAGTIILAFLTAFALRLCIYYKILSQKELLLIYTCSYPVLMVFLTTSYVIDVIQKIRKNKKEK